MHGAIPASEIRDLLRQVQGIDSVDVRQGPTGAIEGIEIAVSPQAAEKRVVRDVESALVSGLGLSIDHRAINIRRTRDGLATGWYPEEITPTPPANRAEGSPKSLSAQFLLIPSPLDDRVRLLRVRCEPDGDLYCQVTVELDLAGAMIERTVREPDTGRGRLMAAGRATATAIASAMGEGTAIALEGVEQFTICEATGVLVLLRIRQARVRQEFYGAALIEADPPEAAARAVLDALNRFLETRDRETRFTHVKGHG